MNKIDLNTWKRTKMYRFMENVDFPFYSVTVPVDVTNVKKVSKEKNISFYMAMTWVVTKAVNSIENFRIRYRNGELYLLDITHPSYTYLKGEDFIIVNGNMQDDVVKFCNDSIEVAEKQTEIINNEIEPDDLIYISCLPWFDFTHLTNERNFDKYDNIPRIAWSKYTEENGRLMLHVSFDVNHLFIDGYHLGLLVEKINELIKEL